MITVYNKDCLEAMKHIQSKTIDMVLCDLPYGVTANNNDIRLPFNLLWKEYKRIIKDNRSNCFICTRKILY